MTDFVTAPFRKLVNMIRSPIMMTLGVTGITMGASSFVTTFKDFTAGMSNVKALSGATNEEFVKLTETAENLGATTKFTATEASEGMQYLAMAGWKTNDIIAAMPGLLDLAAAGGTSLGTAADIVSDVMTAMGMSATEASRAADIFARTATGSNTTIENLGESLKYAAPAAHAFGLSLSEAATITGMMANAGVKGSMAGTALRSSLLGMASPSKSASEAMSKLNLSFADSTGKMKDMRTIIKDLSTAFSGLTEQEKLTYAEDLFGTRGSSAWLAVIEQGADEYERLFKAIDDSNGAAKDMANTQLDNLTGDITLLNSALDGMKISLMKELNPYLRSAVQWVTDKIPMITEKATELVTKIVEKAKDIKNAISDVFNSSEFQNAEGFAGKFFVAWDKLIAEPFTNWWEGGGKQTILDAVAKLGKGLGDLYHGIISGVFAALKGEEVDFDGMNLTGIAKAGAEAAKAFIDSFKEAFDLGGLVNDMPGMLKAGLFGYGAIKVGTGTLSIARTVRDLRLAFGTVAPAAAEAGGAVANVGAQAAAGAAGAGKFATMLGTIGKGLAAIPAWGWVAAAAIAAVAIGVAAYNKAQREHEQALLDTGKAAQQYEEQYVETAQNIERAMATMDEIKKIDLLIEENKGGNAETIARVKEELESVLDKKVLIEAQFARGDITKEEYDALMAQIVDKTVQIKAELIKEGYNEATAQQIIDQYNGIAEGQKTITLILAAKTDLTPDQIQEYVTRLSELMETKTEKELYIKGSGMTANEIKALKEDYDAIKTRTAELEIQINKGQGTMSDDEWNSLVTEYNSLVQQSGEIEIMLKGSEANAEEIKQAQDEVAKLKGEAEGILLKLGYDEGSDLTQSDLNEIAGTLAEIGDKTFAANVALHNTGMSKKEMQALIDKQNELYRTMVETSGGVYTKRDVETGRITQEDFDYWMKDQAAKAAIELASFNAQIKEDRENIPELVEKRNTARAAQEAEDAGYRAAVSDKQFLNDLENKRQSALYTYLNSEQTEADYDKLMAVGSEIKEAGKNYQWSDLLGAPMNFEAIQPEELFGKTTGGWFGTGLFGHWEADKTLNPFGSAMDDLNQQTDRWIDRSEEYGAQANTYDESLNRHYQNEVRAQELNAFSELGFESGLTTSTVQEMANNFANLDTAAQAAFVNALAGIQQLNTESDYIAEDQKVNVKQAYETAQKSITDSGSKAVLNDITTELTHLKATYDQFGTDAQGKTLIPEAHAETAKADLDAINAALESLNLDKISDLSEIGSAIEQINALDPSVISDMDATGVEAVAAALEGIGGSAEETISKLEETKAAAEALRQTYEMIIEDNGQEAAANCAAAGAAAEGAAGTYYIDIITRYSSQGAKGSGYPQLPQIPIPGEAKGGIFDGAFLSWVAEDGPEAIIPLGSDKRDRGLDLWLKAGQMMGVAEFANGGIMAPYTGLFEDAPDDFWDDDSPRELPQASPNKSSSGNTFEIIVEAHPTFEIENTGDGEDILEKLRYHQKELAEMFGGAIADQMADIVANMV